MQPNRQPDGILTDNSPCIFKSELYLFGFFLRQFRKAVQRICSGCHDLVVTLPAFLPAISGKMPWICELLPAHNGVIYNYNNERISLKLKGMSPVQYRTHSLAI